MKKSQVPQDNCKSYSGHRKLIYATDEEGHYQGVQSSGWEVEGYATEMAVQELSEQLQQGKQDYLAEKVSALGYFMPLFRFDIATLAQSTGFFQWQIKRHLRPAIFSKLSQKKQLIYCDIFKITQAELNKPKLDNE